MSRIYPKDFADVVTRAIDLGDNDPLYLGDNRPSSLRWETADGDANVLLFALPEASAIDIPIAVFGDVSSPTIIGRDLGFFDGITQPLVAIIDSDKDSWVGLGFSADDTLAIRAYLTGLTGYGIQNFIKITYVGNLLIMDATPAIPGYGKVFFYDSYGTLGLSQISPGAVYLSVGDASTLSLTQDSSYLIFRAKYWDGSASLPYDFTLYHDITATTPTSLVRFQINGVDIFQLHSGRTAMFSGAASPPTPDSLLHLWNATAGTVTAVTNTILTIENSTHAYLQFLTPNTSFAGFYFGDSNANNAAYFLYLHNSDKFAWSPSGSLLVTYLEAGGFADLQLKRTARAASATLGDEVLCGVTDTSAPRTMTLPSAKVSSGKLYIIKDESGGAGSNAITIVGQGGETIDGVASVAISSGYGAVMLYSDSVNWFII